MIKLLPGTTVKADISQENIADSIFTPMFLTGGLVLSQVAQLTGLEPHTIQNWVKRGFLAPPVQKKYSRRQFSRILIINMLKSTLQMDKICALLSYVNNALDDESDDAIDDSQLYLYLVRMASFAEIHRVYSNAELDAEFDLVLADYTEPFEGARQRLKKVLEIMLIAYRASQLSRLASDMIADLDMNR